MTKRLLLAVTLLAPVVVHADWTPAWVKDQVWYQIFPDRFRNGDPANDPVLEDIRGSWPHFLDEPWRPHPWTSDWYKMQPWEQSNGRDVWLNIQRRRYGGDLQGVFDKLDYLQDLGITAIYFNPVFASPSLHKYDAMSYHHIDPSFGPDRAGDWQKLADENPGDYTSWSWTSADTMFLNLIRECHKRGMRVILDGVFNHMGIRSWVFEDVKKRQLESPYKDWFVITSWDDAEKGTTFDFAGWFGTRELPEWTETGEGLHPGPRDYIFAITKRWMDPDGDGDPSDGIDGWRLDVAFCVDHPFWKQWRKHVKAINPDAYLVAEIVMNPESMKPWLSGDEFDAVMNYNFAFACDEFLFSANPIPASRFDALLRELREAYDDSVNYAQFNLLDSHDMARVSTHAVNRGKLPFRDWGAYHDQARPERGLLDERAPTDAELARQKLAMTMQMTYIGSPVIYYGDEAGMWGANEPSCRKPMVWADLAYEPEAHNPDQSLRESPIPVAFNTSIHETYRDLIRIRHDREELRSGSFRVAAVDDKQRTYAFWRESEKARTLVLLNASDSDSSVLVAGDGLWRDLLDPAYEARSRDGALKIDIPPVRARILVSD